MARFVKICCFLMCFILILVSPTPATFVGTTVSAASVTQGYVNGENVNIRSGPGTSYSSLGKLSYAYVTVNSSTVGTDGKTWYSITTSDGVTGYMHGDYIKILSSSSSDLTFEEQLEQFPESYKASLRALHELYPNWVFKADKLTMSFEEAVENEAVYDKKLVSMTDGISWRSMGEGIYNWSSGTWNTFSGNWTGAAKQVVAYYMDIRNFLNPNDIYMFMQQSYDAATQTEAGIARIVEGTFLAKGYSDASDTAYGGSYVKVIMEAARQSGVSPYVLASTLILEQGVNGTSDLISGTTSYGKYYNFFNFSASGSDVVGNGLAFAKNQGWTTRSASIIGGAKRYAANYIAVGQDTYFYKDFNIGKNTSHKPYEHQYAQSIYDAKSSASGIRSVYSSDYSGSLSFRIPVYISMPDTITEKPEKTDKKNNHYITEMSVNGLSSEFEMYTQSYKLSVSGDTTAAIKLPGGASLASASSVALNSGQNTVNIIIRAETGYTNTYKLTVTASKACTLIFSVNGVTPEPDTTTPSTPSTIIKGDTNGDGKINVVDLANVQKHIVGKTELTGNNFTGGDTNGDGKINVTDLANIQKHIVGKSLLTQ